MCVWPIKGRNTNVLDDGSVMGFGALLEECRRR